MKVSRFKESLTFFCTEELEQCHHFYGGLLELPLSQRSDTFLLYRVTSSSYFGLTSGPERQPAPSGALFELTTHTRGEVDMWYERLHKAGVKTDDRPRLIPEIDVYYFFAFDPNGYRVEIMHYPSLTNS
jgi:catechol 2,3-dioxygenase-like lactoylglutathione lyase family enzyme